MCDYSLENEKNRPAQEGDELQIHQFNSGSRGFAERGTNCGTAVCLQPGAQLRLHGVPQELQAKFGVGSTAEVVFAQLTLAPKTRGYRDGVRFKGSEEIVLIQNLPLGMVADVMPVFAQEEPADVEGEVQESSAQAVPLELVGAAAPAPEGGRRLVAA